MKYFESRLSSLSDFNRTNQLHLTNTLGTADFCYSNHPISVLLFSFIIIIIIIVCCYVCSEFVSGRENQYFHQHNETYTYMYI